MPTKLETLRMQAKMLADALEAVVQEYRSLGLSAAFRRQAPADVHARELVAGMRQAVDDTLTIVGHLTGAQIRAVATELRTRHGLEFDSLQQKRLRH